MEHVEFNLQEHDDGADEALLVFRGMPYESQERLLRHVFQVVAHVDRADDRDAAFELCKDLASTIHVHGIESYHKATLGLAPSSENVAIEDVLKRFG